MDTPSKGRAPEKRFGADVPWDTKAFFLGEQWSSTSPRAREEARWDDSVAPASWRLWKKLSAPSRAADKPQKREG